MSLLGRIRWTFATWWECREFLSLGFMIMYPVFSMRNKLSGLHDEKKQEQVCQKLGFSSIDEVKAHAEDLTPLLDSGKLWL